MKIKTTKEELLRAVSTAAKAVPTKGSDPIFETLLFVGGEKLTVTGTDGDIVISASCEAESEGEACFNGKTISDLVRVLPDGEVTIETNEKSAKVTWPGGHSEMPVFPARDYPSVTDEDGETAEMDAKTFRAAISHILPHVATDILRPQLTGVHFNPTENGTDVVGSDSHTICVYPTEAVVSRPFTVGAKSASAARDASTDTEKVTIVVSDSRIRFVCGDTTVSAREIIGKFPDYRRVIPTGYDNILTADGKGFAQQVRRVATCSSKASNHIKIDLSPMGCTLFAQDLGFGVAAQESLDADYSGTPFAIGFKHDLLLKAVTGLEGEKVNIQFGDPRKAVLVTSEGDPSKCVVMPVAIS